MRALKLTVVVAILVALALLVRAWKRGGQEDEPSEPCCALARLRSAGFGIEDANLLRALADSRPKVRAAALDIVDKRGMDLPASVARALVADSFPPVRERALIMLRLRDHAEAPACPSARIEDALLWELAGCLRGVSSGFREPSPTLIAGASFEALRISVEILSDTLMDGRPAKWWLQHDGRSLRDADRATLSCLRNAPDKESLRILQRALRDPSTTTGTRSTAMWVAKSILSGGSQDRATDAMKRIDSLVDLSEEEVRARLCDFARHALKENGEYALDGMRNLGFCGSPDDVPTLANCLESPDGAGSEYAALALWKLTGRIFLFCQMDDQATRRNVGDSWRASSPRH